MSQHEIAIAAACLRIAQFRAEYALTAYRYAEAAAGAIPEVQIRALHLEAVVLAEEVKIAEAKLRIAEENYS